jgi:hypothetical protein
MGLSSVSANSVLDDVVGAIAPELLFRSRVDVLGCALVLGLAS